MEKITDFTKLSKAEYAQLRVSISTALEALGKQLGVKFTAGNASHTQGFSDIKLNIAVIDSTGHASTKEEHVFKELAKFYGLEATDLNRKFKHASGIMKIVGLKQSSRKNPILVECENKKRYKMDATSVKSLLTTHPVQ